MNIEVTISMNETCRLCLVGKFEGKKWKRKIKRRKKLKNIKIYL